MQPRHLWLLAALALVGSPRDDAHARVKKLARAPEHLWETGLFAPGTTEVAASNRAFSPQYPLWSDGARKSRWVSLPPGRTIDTRDMNAWDFPVGTRFWKEFAYGATRVETRMIWRAGEDDWVFATYAWSADGSDAALVQDGARVAVVDGPVSQHHIPASNDCLACHDAGPNHILGFNALQLSDDRDPLAPHGEPLADGMLTLAGLVAEGRLAHAPTDLVANPPRIPARSPRERAALGYLAGNCGGCHNADGPLGPLGLVLASDARASESAPILPSAIDVAGRYRVPGIDPDDSRRIAPGAPEHSAVLQRMRSRRPSSQMPPLGTQLPDDDAIRLIEDWISHDLARPPTSAATP